MLQTIRDRSQGLIVGVIVFLISLTFALFGIQSYLEGGSEVVVAEADGEEILLREFQDSLQQFRRQAQNVLGENFSADEWDRPEVRRRALNELIDQRLLDQLIDDSQIRVSDAQVANQLRQIPAFHDDNGFSRALYEQRVPLMGVSQQGFEHRLRQDIARSQVRAGVAASAFVTEAEARQIESLREQKRDVGYAILPSSTFEDEIVISDEDVSAYFDANRERYRTDERVRLEYLTISTAALADTVSSTDEALRQYYEDNKAAYTIDEQRNVNHILVQLAESADDEAVAAAEAKVRAVLERAQAGESFEDLAKELSDDVGSRAEGGETGLFSRGVMAPEFEQAAFSLSEGEISEPVRTRFGFHLIRLKEIRPGGTKSFDEARAEVEAAYRDEQAQAMFFDQAEQFSNLVYEQPDSLVAAADVLNLEVETTGKLGRIEIGALFSEKAATAAFSSEVLTDGLNSEPIELDDGRVIALRAVAHEPSRIPPLEDVVTTVMSDLRSERLRERTEAAGRELIEALRKGGTVAEVVGEAGFGWEAVNGATRDSEEANRAVLRVAFRTAVPAGEPVYTGVAIGTTDYAVVRVANVVTPTADELEARQIAQVQQELVQSRAQTAWREFLGALRASREVEVFEERL